MELIVCTGGSCSGKSEFAESLVLSRPGRKAYVATSLVFEGDGEMKDRIARHKERRGAQWYNVECPYDLASHWAEIGAKSEVVLVDCLTMYVTNAFFRDGDVSTIEEASIVEAKIRRDLEDWMSAMEALDALDGNNRTVVVVTNELGMGIVPEQPLSRFFRDIAGRMNQVLARRAKAVYLSVSGITIELKSQEVRHG